MYRLLVSKNTMPNGDRNVFHEGCDADKDEASFHIVKRSDGTAKLECCACGDSFDADDLMEIEDDEEE